MLVLMPFDVRVQRGATRPGTNTDPVAAQLITAMVQREHVPRSHVPEVMVQGLRELTRLRADVMAPIGDVTRRIIRSLDRTFPAFAPDVSDMCGQATALAMFAEIGDMRRFTDSDQAGGIGWGRSPAL